jgi:hypothetical protein
LLPDMLARLRTLQPRPKVVVMSVRPEAEPMALAAGADAFATINASPSELLSILRTIGAKDTA